MTTLKENLVNYETLALIEQQLERMQTVGGKLSGDFGDGYRMALSDLALWHLNVCLGAK